jgi:hypothetical protein
MAIVGLALVLLFAIWGGGLLLYWSAGGFDQRLRRKRQAYERLEKEHEALRDEAASLKLLNAILRDAIEHRRADLQAVLDEDGATDAIPFLSTSQRAALKQALARTPQREEP